MHDLCVGGFRIEQFTGDGLGQQVDRRLVTGRRTVPHHGKYRCTDLLRGVCEKRAQVGEVRAELQRGQCAHRGDAGVKRALGGVCEVKQGGCGRFRGNSGQHLGGGAGEFCAAIGDPDLKV
ncbi:MAG: hypothetical protein AAFR16_02205, partial [Pseudomonadota bacterium]